MAITVGAEHSDAGCSYHAKVIGIRPSEPAVSVDLEEIEYRARVFRMLRSLPADQRPVLEMQFLEETSIREIAQELDRS